MPLPLFDVLIPPVSVCMVVQSIARPAIDALIWRLRQARAGPESVENDLHEEHVI